LYNNIKSLKIFLYWTY